MSVLLYDPDCGFCTASANLLRRLEPRARILPGTPENLVQYRVDARRFAHALPFINDAGQIIYGSDAIALTLRTFSDATLRGKFLRAASTASRENSRASPMQSFVLTVPSAPANRGMRSSPTPMPTQKPLSRAAMSAACSASLAQSKAP